MNKQHKFEYFILRALELMLALIPRRIGLKLGEIAGSILYISGIYRRTVIANMRYVGYWSEEQMTQIIKAFYKNIGRYAADFLRPSSPLPLYRIHNLEGLQAATAQEKGTIAILGHIGNWEVLANVFSRIVKDLSVVAKPMKNEFVDEWLARKRDQADVDTIYTRQALRKIMEVIRRKGTLAILIDQHGGKHGTTVPFLGKDANTVRTVAGIHYKTGCAVVPLYSIMQPDGSYDIYIDNLDPIDTTGMSEDEAITAYQRQHNEIISSWIIKYPEHWFGWFHKRYRGIIKY